MHIVRFEIKTYFECGTPTDRLGQTSMKSAEIDQHVRSQEEIADQRSYGIEFSDQNERCG